MRQGLCWPPKHVFTRFRALSTTPIASSSFPGATQAAQAITTAGDHEDARQRHAKLALNSLTKLLRDQPTAQSLLEIWHALSSQAKTPFLIRAGIMYPQPPRDPTTRHVPNNVVLLQMVTMPEMLELIQRNEQDRFVGAHWAPSATPGKHQEQQALQMQTIKPIPVDSSGTVRISETLVARKIVTALLDLREHQTMIEFIDTVHNAQQSAIEAVPKTATRSLPSTLLSLDYIRLRYITVLARLEEHAKLVAYCEQFKDDLRPILKLSGALERVLKACVATQHGALALHALEQHITMAPAVMFMPEMYELALDANLPPVPVPEATTSSTPSKPTSTVITPPPPFSSTASVDNAMRVYRSMRQQGYVLDPARWSRLVNMCIRDHAAEAAVEVFASFQAHGILPSSTRFFEVLKPLSNDDDIALLLQMLSKWAAIQGTAVADRAETWTICSLLRALLHAHASRPSLLSLLAWMQTRQISARPSVVRLVVPRLLTVLPGERPEFIVQEFLTHHVHVLEDERSAVNHAPVQFALEHCAMLAWTHECQRVLQYANDHQLRVTVFSIGRVLELFASRGDRNMVITLGRLGLQQVQVATVTAETPLEKFPKKFFELLVLALSDANEVDDVVQLNQQFALADRVFVEHPTLPTVIANAINAVRTRKQSPSEINKSDKPASTNE